MVIAPAVALAGIGIHSRTYVDPFEPPVTIGDQERITAYLDIVRDTTDSTSSKQGPITEAQLRRVAHRWIDETESGQLKPLIPVAYDDSVMSGVKGQIVGTMGILHRALLLKADQRIENGQYQEAAENFVLLIQIADTLKYSSFLTVYRSSMLQAGDVNRLDKIFPLLPAKQQATIRQVLAKLDRGPEMLQKIAEHARRLYIEAIRKHANTEMALSTADRMIPAKSFFEQPALAKEKKEQRPRLSHLPADAVSHTLRLPNLTTDASLCMSAENYLRRSIQRILRPKAD